MAPNPASSFAADLAETLEMPAGEPLRERLHPGERIVYAGRLAPVSAGPRGDVATGALAAALAELPDRQSKIARGAR